jgi:hypothetical protein
MTTTLEQPGTTRSPDGLAPAAASPAWKSWAAALPGGEAAGISGIKDPSPELAVHPSRDGGGRKPGTVVQETGGGTDTETTMQSDARSETPETGGRTRRPRTIRAGAGVARQNSRKCPRRLPARSTAQRSRAGALLPRPDRHDASGVDPLQRLDRRYAIQEHPPCLGQPDSALLFPPAGWCAR